VTDAEVPDQIRASVFVAPGQPLELRSFPRPTLAPGETLVEVVCCTLCGSDLHTYLGARRGPAPSVLGHEAVGRIVAFGPGPAPRDAHGGALSIGDRISWSVAASCGACYFCRNELPQKCTGLFKYGHESCCGNHPLSGGLAEFCHLLPGTPILRAPEAIPDVVASFANCATATAAAALRAAGACRGQTVLVQGAGLLGLTAAAMARVADAHEVIGADVDDDRLALAGRFGASTTVNVAAAPGALRDAVASRTDQRGADAIFEMSGSPAAVGQGLEVLRTGGRYVLVGAVKPVGAVPLDVEQVVRRMWRIQGVHNYAPVDLAAALYFLANHLGQFPFAELVAAEYPLQEADAAFQAMAAHRPVRIAVRP